MFCNAAHFVDVAAVPKASFRIDVDNELSEQSLPVLSLTKKHLFELMREKYETNPTGHVFAHSSLPDTNGTFHSFVKNQFLACAYQAFNLHIGFVLSPSQLFLLILQQTAFQMNAEALRNRFVQFEAVGNQFFEMEAKKELLINVSPSPSVDEWAGAIQNIREQIAGNTVPDTCELFSLEGFSTTSLEEQVAGDIALMDICQSYFSYDFMTLCGIPFFILEGSVEDWELLREKAHQVILRRTLPEFSSHWLPALLPTLDKIIQARRGEEVDLAFWNSFFKIGAVDGSGAFTFISGWVNNFFPLRDSSGKNSFCMPLEANPIYLEYTNPKQEVSEPKNEPPITRQDKSEFPCGFSKVPATWSRSGEKPINLYIYSGFVGGIYENHSISPQVGWWIADR